MTTTLNTVESPLAQTMEDFFRTKTSCDVAGTMSFFAPDLATYTDATLGWDIDSFEALQAILEQYMPNWGPPARSYFTAIFSNDNSALIQMVDTPELFGGELRILAAVDFAGGRIVRRVDYWDATTFRRWPVRPAAHPRRRLPHRPEGRRRRQPGRSRGDGRRLGAAVGVCRR